jgi:hypothetical protein
MSCRIPNQVEDRPDPASSIIDLGKTHWIPGQARNDENDPWNLPAMGIKKLTSDMKVDT